MPTDDLLDYFRRELNYLRTQSGDFAARHPNVARHLGLSGSEVADPHIAHLIEAVAFLTARLHREIDRDFPTVACAMLDMLCPNLNQPIPSMTVVKMTRDSRDGKVTAGSRIARGTPLSATATTGESCRFRTIWDATLWPLRVSNVGLDDARTLCFTFQADAGSDLADLEISSLRLHLAGDLLVAMPFYDLLLTNLAHIEVESSAGVRRLPACSLVPAGFGEDEAALTAPGNAYPAFGLLQEYFAFPRKFLFVDLHGLRRLLGHGSQFRVRLVFGQAAPALSRLHAEHVQLNCIPAVNLFPLTGEPIVYDGRHYESLLIPSQKHDSSTEVHSVVAIGLSEADSEASASIPGAFAGTGGMSASSPLSWTMRRAASLRRGICGSDVYLSLIDRRPPADRHVREIVQASLMCTNRQLAAEVMPGTRFFSGSLPASTDIRALYQPSRQSQATLDGEALWMLVALLRLNHGTLVDARAGTARLRDLLGLFATDSVHDAVQIRGIRSISATPGSARMAVGDHAGSWRGYCRGTEIALEFDEQAFAGASPLMLAGVLARFFALYTTANSYVRLTVLRRGEKWIAWPPMSGYQSLI